jgi:hypothetical protein
MAVTILICLLPGQASARPLTEVDLLLAGISINGQESGDIDCYHRQGSEYWLALQDLRTATGLEVIHQGNDLLFKTPIGRVKISREKLWLLDNRLYLSTGQLWQLLRIKVTFDQSAYSLLLDVPWRPGSPLYDEEKINKVRTGRQPDVPAPDGSFGFLRLRSDYEQNSEADEDNWTNTLDSGGALGQGTWLLGLRQEDSDTVRLDRFFWNRILEHNALRLGTSYVDLGMLLNSYFYTGGQWAYSNRDISRYTDFATDLNFDSFLREDLEVQQDIIRDNGPAGGIAELRINDTPVGRVRISLEGHYEFRNIPVRIGSFQAIQVYLYEHSLSDIPEIINLTRSTVRQMLSNGEWLLRGGLGESGNSLYSDYGTPPDGEAAGFLLARYGLTSSLTLQAVVQQSTEQIQESMAGFRLGLGHNWASALDLAVRQGTTALAGEMVGQGQVWDVQLRSNWYDRGYRFATEKSEYDNYLRSFYSLSDSLRIGLVGRYYRDDQQQETNFLKPGFFWNSRIGLAASAVPNLDGEYRITADWFVNPDARFSATAENDFYNLAFDYHFSDQLFSQSGFDYDQDQDDQRVYSRLSWYLDDNRYNYLQGGLSYNGESPGYFISWNRIFTPGIEIQLEYQDNFRTYSVNDEETGSRLLIQLRIDLGIAGTRLVPTDNRRVNLSRGGVSGFLLDQQGNRVAVEDVDVRINGHTLPHYQAGGAFHVGNLRPGIYDVEIDEEKLPIEYALTQKRYSVEVARAAVTLVDFELFTEYGFSGQVTRDNDEPVDAALLTILDSSGSEVERAESGQFGYYRTNALRPGRYRVQLIKIGQQPLPEPYREIQVEIRDDYLFGQDIQLPPSPDPP